MYRGLGGADLGSNWVYPRCTTAPVHHLIPNKQMGVFASSKAGTSGCMWAAYSEKTTSWKRSQRGSSCAHLNINININNIGINIWLQGGSKELKEWSRGTKLCLQGKKDFQVACGGIVYCWTNQTFLEEMSSEGNFLSRSTSPFHHFQKEISLKLQIFFFIMEQSRSCESGWRH